MERPEGRRQMRVTAGEISLRNTMTIKQSHSLMCESKSWSLLYENTNCVMQIYVPIQPPLFLSTRIHILNHRWFRCIWTGEEKKNWGDPAFLGIESQFFFFFFLLPQLPFYWGGIICNMIQKREDAGEKADVGTGNVPWNRRMDPGGDKKCYSNRFLNIHLSCYSRASKSVSQYLLDFLLFSAFQLS